MSTPAPKQAANKPTPKPRPVPKPTAGTQYFWDAAKRGKLALQYDPESKTYQFWPRTISVTTGKRNLEWRDTSGKGEVYSYTVTHVPATGFDGKTPYVVGLIELDEKVRIIGNILNIKPDDVKVGMRVKVMFEKLNDDISYFAFEPDK